MTGSRRSRIEMLGLAAAVLLIAALPFLAVAHGHGAETHSGSAEMEASCPLCAAGSVAKPVPTPVGIAPIGATETAREVPPASPVVLLAFIAAIAPSRGPPVPASNQR